MRRRAGLPLVAPQDVKVDADGNYIVTDISTILDSNGRIDPERSRIPTKLLRISPSGKVEIIARKPRSRFRAVALAAGNGYLVVDMVENAVHRYEPDGGHRTLHAGAPLFQPAGVALAQ